MVYGCWDDHLGDSWAFASYAIQNGFDITTVTGNGKSISNKLKEILPLLDTDQNLTILDCPPDIVVDQFEAWASPYVSTKKHWDNTNQRDIVACQFDGRLFAESKNPEPEIVDQIRDFILQQGLSPISLGGHYTLADCVSILAEAVLFVGVDSGMSHLAHSVGTPCVIYQNKLDVRPYHMNKEYIIANRQSVCTILEDAINERVTSLRTV